MVGERSGPLAETFRRCNIKGCRAAGLRAGGAGWVGGGRQKPLLRASFRAIHGAQRPRQPIPPHLRQVHGGHGNVGRADIGSADPWSASAAGRWRKHSAEATAKAAGLRTGGAEWVGGGRQKPLLRASFRAIHGAQRPRQPIPPHLRQIRGGHGNVGRADIGSADPWSASAAGRWRKHSAKATSKAAGLRTGGAGWVGGGRQGPHPCRPRFVPSMAGSTSSHSRCRSFHPTGQCGLW